jgi:hypothetical protein
MHFHAQLESSCGSCHCCQPSKLSPGDSVLLPQNNSNCPFRLLTVLSKTPVCVVCCTLHARPEARLQPNACITPQATLAMQQSCFDRRTNTLQHSCSPGVNSMSVAKELDAYSAPAVHVRIRNMPLRAGIELVKCRNVPILQTSGRDAVLCAYKVHGASDGRCAMDSQFQFAHAPD